MVILTIDIWINLISKDAKKRDIIKKNNKKNLLIIIAKLYVKNVEIV